MFLIKTKTILLLAVVSLMAHGLVMFSNSTVVYADPQGPEIARQCEDSGGTFSAPNSVALCTTCDTSNNCVSRDMATGQPTEMHLAAACAETGGIAEGDHCTRNGAPYNVTNAGSTSNTPSGANFQGDCTEDNVTAGNCGILSYLLTFINALSALVGVVVVVMIAVGGIQYSTARDNPQMVSAARDRIRNAILGLIAYLFIYALLQYLVPGGIL